MPELMRDNNALSMFRLYADLKVPFTLTCSNYTAELKTDNDKEKFVKSFQSKRTFAAFAKIKSDIKDKQPPDINREQLRYFQHDFRKDGFYKEAYNVDLKSAYATILYNDTFITEATFLYLKALHKPERLACVGMLAAKKQATTFSANGAPPENVITESPFANFFYYAVMKTDIIMTELKKIIGRSYMFTWVDGIYFSDKKKIEPCMRYLETISMKASEETLENFKVTMLEDKVQIVFKKDGKLKGFNLPNRTSEFQHLYHKAMQYYNSKPKTN